MATVIADNIVDLEVHIAARPETIFPFLIEAEKMKQWMGIEAVSDPRPGGTYSVSINSTHVASGKYVEVVPFSRVVFTWGWESETELVQPGDSTIEFTLTPDGDGTIVRLRHLGLPNEEELKGHAEGWEHYMARLVMAAEGHDPGPDPWAAGSGA
jgi:uncharacterized protein YndB with AHSA1/START domain